jgi:hypothetical protein
VVAEEFLVEDPVCVFRADVDVDHGAGEEPVDCVLVDAQCHAGPANATMRSVAHCKSKRTHGAAFPVRQT